MESWRNQILSDLRLRNQTQSDPFVDLISLHSKNLERTLELQQQNTQLLISNEKLRQSQRVEPTAENGSSASAAVGDSQVVISDLKSKLFSLQEEVLELQRRKGENAQQVIDLGTLVKKQEVDINEKTLKIAQLETVIDDLKVDVKRLENEIEELNMTDQLLKDEYQALQLALNSSEKKLSDISKENSVLLAQVIEAKEREVERLNRENDDFLKVQNEKVRKELEEAAGEGSRGSSVGKTIPVVSPQLGDQQ